MDGTTAAAAAAELPVPPVLPGPRDPELDRQLGMRVIAFVITLCVLVTGWAALHMPGSGSGPGSGAGSAAKTSGAAHSGSLSTAATGAATAEARPAKLVQQLADSYTIPGAAPSLPLPSTGQAAVMVEGIGTLGTTGDSGKVVPIASVTKTMTAYLILAHHPLAGGASGPTITVTAAEAGAYDAELKAGQSLVQVYAGEQLSERNALEALMLASADNVAKILARWDAGSASAFVGSMNAAAGKLGMTHTAYTDPSGLDPATVSTAADQIKLGIAAMQSTAFRQIVSEQSATVPKQGTIKNYNTLLGRSGVIGVKTGSTSQAQGCLLFAATVTVGGQAETVIGAVLGQPLGSDTDFLGYTLKVAEALIVATENSLVAATIAAPGKQVAVLRKAGTPDERLGVASALTVVGWPGLTYRVSASGDASAAVLRVSAADSTGNSATSSTASSTGNSSPSVALVPIFSGGAVAAE
jgi:serine-type D-Ala-D-Ala carboxypeptidase (penicillin-binding protein 5/6)